MPHKTTRDASRRRRRHTPPQHREDVLAAAPKRTPRLSEAEKREATRKRRRLSPREALIGLTPYSEAATDAEYQRLADDEVKRAAAVVRATPRDTAIRLREARSDRARRAHGRRRAALY